MNDALDLLERASDSSWPHTLRSPEEVRARAQRRSHARLAAGAAAVCAVLVAAAVAGGALTGGGGPQVAAEQEGPLHAVPFRGVQFVLPADWMLLGQPRSGAVCVGPPSLSVEDCPVLVDVTTEPSAAMESGLDVVPALMDSCDPSDPKFVEVTHSQVNGRASSTFFGRCTQDSPVMTAWALDNRTIYVIAADTRWAEEGETIFENAVIPAEWPEEPDASPSGAPSEQTAPAGPCTVRLTQDSTRLDLPLQGPAQTLRLRVDEPVDIAFEGECPKGLTVTPATGPESNLILQDPATSQLTLSPDITHLVLTYLPCLQIPGGGPGCRGPKYLLPYGVEFSG